MSDFMEEIVFVLIKIHEEKLIKTPKSHSSSHLVKFILFYYYYYYYIL